MTHIDLKDKSILLTGASQGIGKEVAKYLMQMGARVAIHYNTNKASAETLIANGNATNSKLFKADLDVESEIFNLFESVEKTFGAIDVIILNAGVSISHSINEKTNDWLSVWKKTININ